MTNGYNPYAGGWVTPGWWQDIRETPWGYNREGWQQPYQLKNAVKFLNAILPMMRTEQDMLALGRAIASMSQGFTPVQPYARQTGTAGQAFGGDPSRQFQRALGSMEYGPQKPSPAASQQRAGLRKWLEGLWSLAGQHKMTPTGPGALYEGYPVATREQRKGFQQAFGQALKTGPAGAEMYAPWLQKLFTPSVSRPMPGQYQFDPQTQRWQVQRQPRFY